MLYLDASLVVALLVQEVHSDDAVVWFKKQSIGSLFISGWTVTEVSSAFAIKARTGSLSLEGRAAALAAWTKLRDGSLLTLAIADDHFDQAAQIADRYDLGMRGSDALHLAIARDAGCRLR